MLRRLNSVLVLMTTSNSPFSTATLFVATSAWQAVSKEFCRMKRMLVCALLSLAMACGGTALYAQQGNMGQGGGPGAGHQMAMSPDQRLQHMTKMLNLTDDQQQKIKPILDNENQQMQTLRQDTTMSREDKMTKMRDMRQSTNDQIKAVLNADQQKKWEEMQSRQMEHGMGHGGMQHDAPPAGAPPQTPPQ